ncbi:hypothetical protein ACPA2M_08020 [Ectopseudomonas chengduensis]
MTARIAQKIKESLKGLLDYTGVRLVLLASFSLIIILIGFFVSIYVTKNPNDAGRGGAVVVALSFYFILRPNHHVHSYVPEADRPYIQGLLEKETAILLSFMSVIGTLAWGFLDILAAYFI